MASDDCGEMVEGANEDMRLCGGDDDEDMHDALFGHSIKEPIEVDDDPVPVAVDDDKRGARSPV